MIRVWQKRFFNVIIYVTLLSYLLTLSKFSTIFNVIIVDFEHLIVCYAASSSNITNEFVEHQFDFFILVSSRDMLIPKSAIGRYLVSSNITTNHFVEHQFDVIFHGVVTRLQGRVFFKDICLTRLL